MQQGPTLLDLPDEVIHQSLSYLDPESAIQTSGVCRRLHAIAHDDVLWHAILQSYLHTPLTTCKPKRSYRELYQALQPYWFIAQRKLWFSDVWPYGKLLLSKYDERRGCIEAYTLTAESGPQQRDTITWLDGTEVHSLSIRPRVRLDLNKPVVSIALNPPTLDTRGAKASRHQKEVVMHDSSAAAHPDTPGSSFMLTHALPAALLDSRTKFWPPLTLPSPAGQRTRNDSRSSFTQPATKPRSAAEASDATFRVRRWMQFGALLGGLAASINPASQLSTFATLPAACYTPTPAKPWQGIWCSEYYGHGCEFLLVTQPDSPQRLPRRARTALAAWPRPTVAVQPDGRIVSTLPDDDGNDDSDSSDDDEDVATYSSDSDASPATSRSGSPHAPTRPARPSAANPYAGRLEAVKLTGDVNVPRGEYTFVAPDLGDAGLVGHMLHPALADPASRLGLGGSGGLSPANGSGRGVRVVKSVGHVGRRGFAEEGYLPSQLVMVSENRLAQYWMEWGAVMFFDRVDVDAFVKEPWV